MRQFIDIHNHMIYGIDDGAKTEAQTVEMLQTAAADGIKKVIFTPHYAEKFFVNTRTIIESKMEEMQALIEKHEIAIDIYFGSEVFINKNTSSHLMKNKIRTMNDTNYLLVETHRKKLFQTDDLFEELYNLKVDGYKCILAHPERYEFVHENPNLVYDLIEDGHYIQINATSITNKKSYSYKVARKLLEHKLVHFIATDSHDLIHRPPILSEAYAVVEKLHGEAYANDLFYNNQLKVIENKRIESKEHKKIRSFFQFLKKGG